MTQTSEQQNPQGFIGPIQPPSQLTQGVYSHGKERPISRGGRIFDWMTYGGFSALLTLIITPPIANLFMEGGKLHGVDTWMRKTARNLGASENIAKEFARTTHFMHGGNLMLIPVAIMEKFRTPIVNRLNRALNDPTDPKSVEDAPPQTLSSIIKGRLVAWVVVFSAFTGVSMAMGEKRFDGMLDRAGTKLCNLFGKPTQILNKSGQLVHSTLYKIGHNTALDFLATASAATLLYVTSHYFANSEAKERHEAERRAHLPKQPEQPISYKHAEPDQLSASDDAVPTASVSHVSREAHLANRAEVNALSTN
jgi:hypothetical protein